MFESQPYLNSQKTPTPLVSRRNFIKNTLLGVTTVCLPSVAFAATKSTSSPSRRLAFYNTHTHEHLDICYHKRGQYLFTSLKEIDYILRDHRTNEIKPINTDLLNFVHAISLKVKTKSPFHVISGYRSIKTNQMLRRATSGVAAKSLHTVGKAIDIRLPGMDTNTLRQTAAKLKKGGVGYYRRSDFVHVDIGAVRYWRS